uniref:Uncharacterized protein n=1 Tax=Tanacetum cinerariifolium TaxID=118510 RepID=A0A6L2NBQ9_TANCI|nr:hypothetical protein [Tanacetum cinerariifolium]
MTLLSTLLETCATLTKQVANLEQDKVAQAIEITKLKKRVRTLEGCIQTGRGITELDADKDVTLEDVDTEVAMDDDDTDEAEPTKVKEVIKVVTAAKLMTEVVTTAATTIIAAQVKSKDKGKGILIEEPKPLKRLAQLEYDEAFARQLKAKLNANINGSDVMDHVKRKEKQDNTVMRYQALKKKPVTEAHARKNMMVYLKNMAGFKMDFFKGEEEITEQKEGSKRKDASPEHRTAKKQRIDEEEEELKIHLHIIVNDDDDVFTEATPLALKKPNVEASIWREQKGRYGLAKLKSLKLLKSCGVHIITFKTTRMIMLVERKYPLTHFTLEQMLNNVRLEVEEDSEMSLELLRKYAKGLLLLVEDLMMLVQVKAAR